MVDGQFALREGDGNACVTTGGVDALDQVPAHRPVVASFYPWADDEVDAALGQFADRNTGGRLFQDARVFGKQALDERDGLRGVVLIADAQFEVDAARGVGVEINNGALGNLVVGDDDAAVVRGAQGGGKNVDFFQKTGDTGDFYIVPNLERADDDEHDAGGEIGQRITQRQADGQTGSTKDGEHRGGGNADVVEHGDGQRNQQHDVDGAREELDQHVVQLAAVHQVGGDGKQAAYQPFADKPDEQGTDDAGSPGQGDGIQPVFGQQGVELGEQGVKHGEQQGGWW